jgi:very-short-patch-repair endonuclease
VPARPHPTEVLARLGHTATAADLAAVSGRPQLRSAVASGDVVRVARGHYALPDLVDPRLTAARLQGVVSHASAARLWGLDVFSETRSPHVTVPQHRKGRRTSAVLHWVDLAPADVVDGLTSPVRTVLDCARTLSLPAALAVADSAVRLGRVGTAELQSAAEAVRGPGRSRVRRVVAACDGRAGSGLESFLRGTLVTGRVRGFAPQVEIRDGRFFARVDLGHEPLRIALEADSFEHHGFRAALVRDCRRYDELTVRGWMVLRFAWEHVMFESDWVLSTVQAAVASRLAKTRRTGPTQPSRRPNA